MRSVTLERLLRWPFANVCSDGTSTGLHPRGFGSFANRRVAFGGGGCARRTEDHRAGTGQGRCSQEFASIETVDPVCGPVRKVSHCFSILL